MNNILQGRKVSCLVAKAIPAHNESILDDFPDLPIDKISDINIYLRPPHDCPFARGNVIIDIYFENGEILCFKLPLATPPEIARNWVSALTINLKKRNHDESNS